MYRITLLTKKTKKLGKRSTIKAQQIIKILVHNTTSAMFQNKKLKLDATSEITEVVKLAPCASNCTFSTSGIVAPSDLHVLHFQAYCLLQLKPHHLFCNQ